MIIKWEVENVVSGEKRNVDIKKEKKRVTSEDVTGLKVKRFKLPKVAESPGI